MSKVRLQIGHFVEGEVNGDEHSYERPVMLVYAGTFDSMDGEVTVKDEHINRLVANHNSYLSKFKRLASGELPARANPPIQLDHSPSASVTVGRLVGNLRADKFLDDDGTEKLAVYGRLRILGKENVEKAKDGRWEHVSIGADLEQGKLNELSITPFPAAPNASMLSRLSKWKVEKISSDEQKARKLVPEENQETLEKYCIVRPDGSWVETLFVTEEDAQKYIAMHDVSMTNKGAKMGFKPEEKEKFKKHLKECKKMSEEDAEKHLAKCEEDEEEGKKLAAECDEEEKKMAAAEEEDKKKLASEETEKAKAQMTAARASFKKLAGDFRSNIKSTRLEARKAEISSRLSSLRANARITPAEQKKVDLTELAGKSDDAVNAFFDGFKNREPVIPLGLYGTRKATDLTKLAQQAKNNQLTKETISNMPFMSRILENRKKLSEGEPGAGPTKTEVHIDTTPHTHEQYMNAFMDEHQKLMDEGKHDEAKMKLREHLMKLHGLSEEEDGKPMPMGPEHEKQMSGLAQSIEKMQNQFQELVTLVSPVLGVEAENL